MFEQINKSEKCDRRKNLRGLYLKKITLIFKKLHQYLKSECEVKILKDCCHQKTPNTHFLVQHPVIHIKDRRFDLALDLLKPFKTSTLRQLPSKNTLVIKFFQSQPSDLVTLTP